MPVYGNSRLMSTTMPQYQQVPDFSGARLPESSGMFGAPSPSPMIQPMSQEEMLKNIILQAVLRGGGKPGFTPQGYSQ